jgi:cytochrome b pre-mRNA-processing protein 3
MNRSQQGGFVAGLRRLLPFGKGERVRQAAVIYGEAVARARRPELYDRFGVPDTPAGRFEMVAWQVILEMNRLSDRGEQGRKLAQEVVDLMFADMDRSLRDLGVGDMSVGREMRKLGEAWKARIVLAERALPSLPSGLPADVEALATFLAKNAGDGAPVDAQGLAADLLATLAQLRAGPS